MNPALEVFTSFLKLGFTAFGGPAAHIGMFRDEFVRRRKWLTDEAFLDLLGATNLIPGPNSTEMAIHIGFLRAGWAGLVLGGLAFTLPAVLIVLVLAWLYVQYGSTPQAAWLLYGIKPVMIAIHPASPMGNGAQSHQGKINPCCWCSMYRSIFSRSERSYAALRRRIIRYADSKLEAIT